MAKINDENIDLDHLVDEWEEDCRIDKRLLDLESLKAFELHAKYSKKLLKARAELNKYKQKKNQIYKALWLYYTGSLPVSIIDKLNLDRNPFGGRTRPPKNEIEMWIKDNELYQKRETKLEKIQTTVDFLNQIITMINWRHQPIKNAIDFQKQSF